MDKKLAIIVPVYNIEKYLSVCIESLLNQDYDNYEIILVDDGSTDNSKSVCKQYEKKHPEKIKVYSKKNGGASSARNYGIKKTNADYIFFVDGDDYIKSNCLNLLMKKIGNNDIMVFNYVNVSSNGIKILEETFDSSILDLNRRYLLATPSPCNKIFKASLFKENNLIFPNEIFYEDLALIPSIGSFAKNIIFDEEAYYFYLQRDGSTMHQKKYNSKLEDIFTALDILESNIDKKYKEEIEYLYIWHLLRNASLRFLDFNKLDMLEKINKIIKNKFPNWNKNIYYKKNDIKRKVMCTLLMMKQYKLVELLRNKGGVNK